MRDICEQERIKAAYEKRKDGIPSGKYSFFNPGNYFMVQRRDHEIINALRRYGITSLGNLKILDIGCGTGGELRNFLRYGASPENLVGIDLLSDRIEQAKKISPNIEFRCGDASKLPYPENCFDMALQFTVFTSILDPEMKKRVASEMIRVLKPGGVVVWYDYHMNNPANRDVKGVKIKEIQGLFQNCEIHLKRAILAPPISRILAPYSWLVGYLLEKLGIFNTHYIGIIRKAIK